MRVKYRKIRHARYLYIKRNVEKVWGARYTLGARYLSKNTVYQWTVRQVNEQTVDCWRQSSKIYTISDQLQRTVLCTEQQQLHVPKNINTMIGMNG